MIGKKILNTIFHSFIVYWSVQEGGVVNQKYNYYYILNLDPRLQIIAIMNSPQMLDWYLTLPYCKGFEIFWRIGTKLNIQG